MLRLRPVYKGVIIWHEEFFGLFSLRYILISLHYKISIGCLMLFN